MLFRSVPVHNIQLVSVLRKDLDGFALEKFTQLGGICFDGISIRDIDSRRHVATGIGKDRTRREFSFDAVVMADGALSHGRQVVAGQKPDAVLSLEAEVTATGAPLLMKYTEELWGYYWYIPAGNVAKIGCVSYGEGRDLETSLSRFASSLGIAMSRVRGAFIPTGGSVLLKHKDAYFLGDAAGLICPPSGEGIYYALKSARMAAQALANAANYEALMARDAKVVEREYRTRQLFFNRKFMDSALAAAEKTPYGSERAVKFALRHFCSFDA